MKSHFAITGAKGTGKSTLSARVAARIAERVWPQEMVFVGSPGTLAKSRGLSLGQMGSDQTHIFFAAMHLRAIQDNPNQTRFLDRCLVDHLAYVKILSTDAALIEMMTELTRVASRSYATVFVTRLHVDLPAIPDDSESIEFRHVIESEILSILRSFKVPHIELSTSLDIACEQIVETIVASSKNP